MADATLISELVDLKYVMGITAASKHQTEEGNVFVDVHLEVRQTDTLQSGGASKGASAASVTKVVPLRLSIPQFYTLLSTLEEAKAGLIKATE